MNYLLKILYLLVFALIVILTYYYGFSFHRESFELGYGAYIVSLIFLYGAYKWYHLFFHEEEVTFTPLKIMGFFLLHLFLLSVLFFVYNENSGGLGINLFFTILGYLFLPVLLVGIFLGVWKKLLSFIPEIETETKIFQFLASLGVWFFVFITLVTVLWMLGFYNVFALFLILVGLGGFAYKEIIAVWKSLYTFSFSVPNHQSTGGFLKWINSSLLSAEFFFIVITFLLSINLINAVRPMPIGWDDLGVYMNYPQLLAQAGEIISLGGMYSWQVFTGIWYLFHSPTQAFILNNLWGILSVLVIVLSFMDLLKSRFKTLIHVPLLAGMMFASMPMIIFQQAKDMKLDPGLFFVSSIAVYMILYLFLKYLGYREVYTTSNGEIISDTTQEGASLKIDIKSSSNSSFLQYFSKYEHIGLQDMFAQKKYLLLIAVIGLLVGCAFGIKFTSLLLISWILWVLFYAKLGVAGLFGYFSLYIGIFTKAWLWSMMNVVYPKDDMSFRNSVFLASLVLAGVLFSYSWYKYKTLAVKKLLILVSLFLVWVGIWVSPWLAKNIITSSSLSISSLLNGTSQYFQADYSKILSPEEKQAIDSKRAQTTMSSSWTSIDEDLGRYFWYEQWVNNYIKLPYNLTMQNNQRGEYTEITYWYLALIPWLLLFLGYKHPVFSVVTLGVGVLGAIFFFWPQIHILLQYFSLGGLPDFMVNFNKEMTTIFAGYSLPWGYSIVALFFILPFLFVIYGLDRSKFSVLFKLNAVFAVFYIFLWAISAFGIVWYGIVMYYSLLLIVALWVFWAISYEEKTSSKEKIFRGIGAGIIFFLVTIYTFQSTFPHGMNNLKNASYAPFKAWLTDTYSSIFDAQMKYYDVLVELNIDVTKRQEVFATITSMIRQQQLKQIISENNISDLKSLNAVFTQLSQTPFEANNTSLNAVITEARTLREELYKYVLYPKTEWKNTKNIYRIWTFLKYFITDNNKRLFEDGLVFEFDKYFYEADNTDASLEKMKKLWVEYFLVDLNAATIDRDPRRALTKRYETLLTTFTSERGELVTTDSICLQTALERYKKSSKTEKDFQEYMELAGVNYESYDEDWNLTLNRNQKLYACYNFILEQIEKKQVSQENYAHLIPIVNYMQQNPEITQEQLGTFFSQYVTHGWMVLFKIK